MEKHDKQVRSSIVGPTKALHAQPYQGPSHCVGQGLGFPCSCIPSFTCFQLLGSKCVQVQGILVATSLQVLAAASKLRPSHLKRSHIQNLLIPIPQVQHLMAERACLASNLRTLHDEHAKMQELLTYLLLPLEQGTAVGETDSCHLNEYEGNDLEDLADVGVREHIHVLSHGGDEALSAKGVSHRQTSPLQALVGSR